MKLTQQIALALLILMPVLSSAQQSGSYYEKISEELNHTNAKLISLLDDLFTPTFFDVESPQHWRALQERLLPILQSTQVRNALSRTNIKTADLDKLAHASQIIMAGIYLDAEPKGTSLSAEIWKLKSILTNLDEMIDSHCGASSNIHRAWNVDTCDKLIIYATGLRHNYLTTVYMWMSSAQSK